VALRLEAIAFDVADATLVADFWATLLDREVRPEPGGALVPGDDRQVGLRFVTSGSERDGRPRLHLHLTTSSWEHQQRTVDTALRLGGRHLDVGQAPEDEFVVLGDPGGNELCVIEPGNRFLAGTGPLGEVTCDGSREVGQFWGEALGWPLVWDEGEQIAIQSPIGGTKISWDAWARPAVDRNATTGPRFDLLTSDLAGETERLVALGATRLADRPAGIELADPDGNPFTVHAG
jgi:Glyoxalase-like domain